MRTVQQDPELIWSDEEDELMMRKDDEKDENEREVEEGEEKENAQIQVKMREVSGVDLPSVGRVMKGVKRAVGVQEENISPRDHATQLILSGGYDLKRHSKTHFRESTNYCRDFYRNQCKRGTRCKFIHGRPPSLLITTGAELAANYGGTHRGMGAFSPSSTASTTSSSPCRSSSFRTFNTQHNHFHQRNGDALSRIDNLPMGWNGERSHQRIVRDQRKPSGANNWHPMQQGGNISPSTPFLPPLHLRPKSFIDEFHSSTSHHQLNSFTPISTGGTISGGMSSFSSSPPAPTTSSSLCPSSPSSSSHINTQRNPFHQEIRGASCDDDFEYSTTRWIMRIGQQFPHCKFMDVTEAFKMKLDLLRVQLKIVARRSGSSLRPIHQMRRAVCRIRTIYEK